MVLYVSGQREADVLHKALSDHYFATHNEYALKLLNRCVNCMIMQGNCPLLKGKKEKAATTKDSD